MWSRCDAPDVKKVLCVCRHRYSGLSKFIMQGNCGRALWLLMLWVRYDRWRLPGMISNAPDSHSDLSSPCIRFSCNMALTTLAAKRGMRALSHQAAAPALPAQCGRASCWGTTGMRAVKVKCTKEPIIAQHSFSRHVVWGNPLPSVNICLFIGFCIWKCIVLTITCITCLVAYTWSPDRPLYIRMPCKHCQLLYRQHTRAHTTMNRCDVCAFFAVSPRLLASKGTPHCYFCWDRYVSLI